MDTDIKTVAEFMGEELPYKNEKGNWEFNVKSAGLINSSNIEDLNKFLGFTYDTDWNSLMPVVNKLKAETDFQGFLDKLTTTELEELIGLERRLELCFKKNIIEISDVYSKCVEFIEWYNQIK